MVTVTILQGPWASLLLPKMVLGVRDCPGWDGPMLHMDCPLLDKSAPTEMSPAISSPEMKRWKVQATQRMKCHGKLDKNPKKRN